jgi:hypothetical protein
VSNEKQELFTLQESLGSSLGFDGIRVSHCRFLCKYIENEVLIINPTRIKQRIDIIQPDLIRN